MGDMKKDKMIRVSSLEATLIKFFRVHQETLQATLTHMAGQTGDKALQRLVEIVEMSRIREVEGE